MSIFHNKIEKKIIAIIPARGGSKGLLGKNIKPILDKPLVAWTIGQAKNSKYIDRLLVSTDDKKIAEISRKYGADIPFLRPEELAKDDSPISDAIIHAINWFEKKGETFDIVVLLEPTSPLRKEDDIDNAIKLFAKNIEKADSLVSLGTVQLEKPHILKKVEDNFVVPFIKTKEKFYRRQQMPESYFPYGVIYLSKVDTFKRDKTFYQKKTIPYFVERWQNYEVDDVYDFLCNETILKNKLNKKTI